MGGLVDLVTRVVQPWIDFYGDSVPTEAVVVFLHLGGLVVAGGLAFSFDRAVLRAGSRPSLRTQDVARELGLAHGAVLVGLAIVAVSGVALVAADPATFLVSPLFWAKMALVALLLANGWLLKRSGETLALNPDDPTARRRLSRAAVRSVALWGGATLLGVLLTLAA